MARRWVVLTADRDPHVANEIIIYTEWDGYVALADEVIYTDPVDADGNAVDALWKVSGSVTRAGAGTAADPYVYTYADNSLEPSLIDRQRGQIHDAYLYWRVFGRTGHWEGLRRDLVDPDDPTISTREIPLDATDKWAFHVVALVDHAINGTWPISGALSAENLQGFIDHAEFILRNLGPTWYLTQIGDMKVPTEPAGDYAGMGLDDGDSIYSDIATVLGVNRTIDGMWVPMAVNLRAGFDPEARNLGN